MCTEKLEILPYSPMLKEKRSRPVSLDISYMYYCTVHIRLKGDKNRTR